METTPSFKLCVLALLLLSTEQTIEKYLLLLSYFSQDLGCPKCNVDQKHIYKGEENRVINFPLDFKTGGYTPRGSLSL